MPDHRYILTGILLSAAITWTLRAAPFAMLARMRHNPLLEHVGRHMPVGIMMILVVYTLRDVHPTSWAQSLPVVAALAVTVGLHLWRHNATLSIFAGTAVCVVLSSAVAAGLL